MSYGSSRKSLPAKKAKSNSTLPRSRKASVPPKTKAIERAIANRKPAFEPSTNQHKPATRTRNRVPAPQRVRIIQKFVPGENITQIASQEHRSRESVARIVKGDEVQKLVRGMKAELYGLASDAIDAVRHALREQKDARLGYRLLLDIGAVPRPAEAEANAFGASQPDPEELTPYERAAAQDDSGQINPLQLALVRAGQEKAAAFGFSNPTAEEIWRNRSVIALINEMTDGQSLRIDLSNGVEWNHLKALAEDVLQGKRAMTDPEIVAVRKKYSE